MPNLCGPHKPDRRTHPATVARPDTARRPRHRESAPRTPGATWDGLISSGQACRNNTGTRGQWQARLTTYWGSGPKGISLACSIANPARGLQWRSILSPCYSPNAILVVGEQRRRHDRRSRRSRVTGWAADEGACLSWTGLSGSCRVLRGAIRWLRQTPLCRPGALVAFTVAAIASAMGLPIAAP